MSDDTWVQVDDYIVDLLVTPDEHLTGAIAFSTDQGLPAISVAANQGKLLQLLARSHRARRILEVGTLGGYSTIWLARALPEGGHLVTLELDAHHADVARTNIDRAGLGDIVSVTVGPAAQSMRDLIADGAPPFDMIFIDADKVGYPDYFNLALQLSRPGTLIVADNVVRNGAVVDPESADEMVQGVRTFLQLVADEPRVSATAVQTVGSKGYDGFALILVID